MTELTIESFVKNGIPGYLFDGEFFRDYEDAKREKERKKREKEEIENMSKEERRKLLEAIADKANPKQDKNLSL